MLRDFLSQFFFANVMNGVVKEPETEQNEEPEQGYISEQCDKPVEEEQQPEAAPTEEVQEEPAASEESNGPVSEELPAAEPESEEEHTEAVVDEEPVELTKFEQAMISLMKRGNIPENVYAIEEYKEGAVCLKVKPVSQEQQNCCRRTAVRQLQHSRNKKKGGCVIASPFHFASPPLHLIKLLDFLHGI